MFTPVRHSFALVIDKQLSRKATLMFQDVLLFHLFHKNTHLNQFKTFPVNTYRSVLSVLLGTLRNRTARA